MRGSNKDAVALQVHNKTFQTKEAAGFMLLMQQLNNAITHNTHLHSSTALGISRWRVCDDTAMRKVLSNFTRRSW